MALDIAQILERMAAGEFAARIARDIGVSKQALSQRLRRTAQREYRAAMRQGAAVRLLALLRRCRDYRDVSRKALRREVLYGERWAPQIVKAHANLIETALWRYCQSRWPASRLQRHQSQEVTDEIAAIVRMWERSQQAAREQATGCQSVE